MDLKKIKRLICHLFGCQKKHKSSDVKWWLMVRPNNFGLGENGIILYNETKSKVEKTLPFPPNLSSPHALDFDGKSLWVGGYGSNVSIYEIDPTNGSILSEIKNIRTEGIAVVKEGIWYSDEFGSILHFINRDGTARANINVSATVVQDIAVYGFSRLFYVFNGATDPIIEVNIFNGLETTLLYTNVSALYTLTIKDDNFAVIGDNNQIILFNMTTGVKISETQLPITGWITAFSAYDK